MSLDARARRAAGDFRRAIEEMDRSAPEHRSFEHFDRYRLRKQRSQRINATIVAAALTIAVILVVTRALGGLGSDTPVDLPEPGGGLILYGVPDPELDLSHWFTVRPDGTDLTDLHVAATCAVWFPDGSKILITNDAAVGPGAPLRPAVIDPDGSDLTLLDATKDPDLDLGCGHVSPDGARIMLEGFGGARHLQGIYSVRASDGGGAVRLLRGLIEPPDVSPDGTRVTFKHKIGSVDPPEAGALFVMNADGTGLTKITPAGYVLDIPAWSPDGEWIVFQRPFGELFIVHPDGTDLHRVPVQLPADAGAQYPSWSPDGSRIVFTVPRGDASGIYIVRIDGTGLQKVAAVSDSRNPDWAPA